MKRFNNPYFSGLSYEIFDNDITSSTYIYKDTIVKRKKYFLFGEEIEIIKPKFYFSIFQNIESSNLSKETVFNILKKAREDKDKLIARAKEIENGDVA